MANASDPVGAETTFDLSTASALNLGPGASDGGGLAGGSSSDTLLLPGDAPPVYAYSQEISQMLFVFGDIEDPPEDVLKLIEDIVRTQVIEMIIQSRRIAQRRGSRTLAPEDIIFLIRYDRAKVNRLRIYLSWKEVRKKAKESDDVGAGAAGEADIDDAGAMDVATKVRKMNVKLPWELGTIYSEHLRPLAGDDADEEDEDDIEAHEDSLSRLKEADEATRRMTREEYVHYSECRQASFTFRKGKKFRDFVNASAYLDGGKNQPHDDIVDILGFLAFEVVRELCEGALKVQKELEETKQMQAKRAQLAVEAAQQRSRDRGSIERERSGAADAGPQSGAFPAGAEAERAEARNASTSPQRNRGSTAPRTGPSAASPSKSTPEAGRKSSSPVAVRSSILKQASGTSVSRGGNQGSRGIELDADENRDGRPRKRARFVEPAEQQSTFTPRPSSVQSDTFSFVDPPTTVSSTSPTSSVAQQADSGRGATLSHSRAPDALEKPVALSHLFLPNPHVPMDLNDPSTLCSLFAPPLGTINGLFTASPSSSPALSSGSKFGVAEPGPSTMPRPAKKAAADGDDDAAEDGEGSNNGDDDVNGAGDGQDTTTTRSKPVKGSKGADSTALTAADAQGTSAQTEAPAGSSSRRDKPPPPQFATSHIYEAFARLQRRRTSLTGSSRPSGTGGLRRTRMFVI